MRLGYLEVFECVCESMCVCVYVRVCVRVLVVVVDELSGSVEWAGE